MSILLDIEGLIVVLITNLPFSTIVGVYELIKPFPFAGPPNR